MRTVHEIETGKPETLMKVTPIVQDTKSKRRRSPSLAENGQVEEDADQKSDVDDPELALYSDANRYRYLKRKLKWATDRNAVLKKELQETEGHLMQNWTQKEALLDHVFVKESITL